LSPLLCRKVLTSILQKVASDLSSSIKIVLYVDDLTIIGDNENKVLEAHSLLLDYLRIDNLELKDGVEMICKNYLDEEDDVSLPSISKRNGGEIIGACLGEEAVKKKGDEILGRMRDTATILRRFEYSLSSSLKFHFFFCFLVLL